MILIAPDGINQQLTTVHFNLHKSVIKMQPQGQTTRTVNQKNVALNQETMVTESKTKYVLGVSTVINTHNRDYNLVIAHMDNRTHHHGINQWLAIDNA